MARYEHLPVYRKAYLLALAVEREVHRFSRFHKYAIGADLRELTRAILRRIIRANNQSAKRPDELEVLRTEVEEFLVLNRLAKDSRAFSGLKAYEECANLAISVSRQTEGWLRSSRLRGQKPGEDA